VKKLIIQICNYIAPYYIMLTSKYVPRKEINLKLGNHIEKKSSIYETLLCAFNDENYQKSVQFFLHNPRSGKMSNITDDDIINTTGFVDENEIKMYVHTPYIINLSNPINKNACTNNEPPALKILREDLETMNHLGGKGVVVHVGKSLKNSVADALDTMFQSIQYVLQFATEKCPLLLETPAHQGTELCCTYQELKQFYDRFTDDEKKNFKICVDTCHIFASNYDPLEYIKMWQIDEIGLIHLNDSKCERGSCKDRHAYIGTGYIGYDRLKEVVDYCDANNLDMVVE